MKILAFERKVKSGKSHFLEKFENENIKKQNRYKNRNKNRNVKKQNKY